MVKKDNAKLFLNFVTGGVALHGPSPILFTSLHAYFDRHGADLQRLWSLLQPHVRSDPLVGTIGDVDGGDSNWMVIPVALEKRIHSDPALQRELFTGGRLDLTDDGLSYTWIDPAIVHSSSVVCNTLLVCFAIPATLITIGIMLVLTAVVLPLVLFPYVMYSHCVDQVSRKANPNTDTARKQNTSPEYTLAALTCSAIPKRTERKHKHKPRIHSRCFCFDL